VVAKPFLIAACGSGRVSKLDIETPESSEHGSVTPVYYQALKRKEDAYWEIATEVHDRAGLNDGLPVAHRLHEHHDLEADAFQHLVSSSVHCSSVPAQIQQPGDSYKGIHQEVDDVRVARGPKHVRQEVVHWMDEPAFERIIRQLGDQKRICVGWGRTAVLGCVVELVTVSQL